MNTANLQLEGFQLALAAITRLLRDKGILSGSEMEAVLAAVEDSLLRQRAAPGDMSKANLDAVCFPVRFQRIAFQSDAALSFNAIAADVHRTKAAHPLRARMKPELVQPAEGFVASPGAS